MSSIWSRYFTWRALKQRLKPTGPISIDLHTGKETPVKDTEAGKLFETIAAGKCPACGSRKGFYQGPSGGMSMNIKCANDGCAARFNITPLTLIGGGGIAARL